MVSAAVIELAIDAGDYVSCGGDDGGCPALVPIGLRCCPLCGRTTRPDGDEPFDTPPSALLTGAEPTRGRRGGLQQADRRSDGQPGGAHRKPGPRRLHVVRPSNAEQPPRAITTASDRPGGRHRARRSA